MMMLVQPAWLLFLVPLGALCWWAYRQRPPLFSLRLAVAFLALLVLAEPRRLLPDQDGTLVLVCDRSASMPLGSNDRQHEWIQMIHEQRPTHGAKMALIGFEQQAFTEGFAVETTPTFATTMGGDGSNLNAALHLAGNLIGQSGAGRILILSDGMWTGKDPKEATRRLATRGIAVDFVHQEQQGEDPVAIQRLDAPSRLGPGEGFMIHAWLMSTEPRTITYRLTRGDTVVSSGEQALSTGANRLLLRDLAPESGNHRYQLTIHAKGTDPRPENNKADFLLAIEAPKPLLHITHTPQGTLARSLSESRLTVHSRSPDQMEPSLAQLSGYAAVLIENVSANELGDPLSAYLAAWVRESGGGLLMLGGKNAFGVGGYYRSPLDPILPVSMELRKEQRKHQMAMVVALDRSGSMGATVGGGRTKMDLANIASAEVVNLLSAVDMYGHLAVDSQAHTVVNLQKVTDKGRLRRRIRSVEAGGGGIYVYEALVNASRMIMTADREIRHIILFADAADAEQPGETKALLAKLRGANITVSVVALGTEQDPDAALLKEIAQDGGGRIYFTHDAGSLPRVFAQDTFVVARSSFVEEITPTRFTPLMQSLSTSTWPTAPKLGGYNLTYLRDEAQTALLSDDEHRAPLLAWWYAGNGRVMTFTGEAAGPFTGELAQWPQYGAFFASLARWVAGSGQSLPGNSVVTTDWNNGVLTTRLHLDPLRSQDPFERQPNLHVLRGRDGVQPERESLRFQWETPHELVTKLTMDGRETVLPTVAFGTDQHWQLAPVRLPYSPEFAPGDGSKGGVGLADLARISGGREWLSPGGIWDQVPLGEGFWDLRPPLLMLMVFLFVLEVAERRMVWSGMVGRRLPRKATPTSEPVDQAPTPSEPRRRQMVKPNQRTKPKQQPQQNEPPKQAGLADALKNAKKTADQRTRRD